MVSPDKSYISAENATGAVTWLPPQVGKQANKIPSAEKEAKEAKRRAAERAKESVEDVVPAKLPTAEEIAGIFDAARKEGFSEGLEAGKAQGFEQGRKEGTEKAYAEQQAKLEQLKLALSNTLVNLAGPSQQQQQALATTLVQLVKRLTRKVVLSELATPSPHIENLVSSCVSLLPATQTQRKARIQLHPDDLAYLRGEAQMAAILNECEWVADESISVGGCLVNASSSQLDATVESQLQALFENFDKGSFSHETPDDLAREEGDTLKVDLLPLENASSPSETESKAFSESEPDLSDEDIKAAALGNRAAEKINRTPEAGAHSAPDNPAGDDHVE